MSGSDFHKFFFLLEKHGFFVRFSYLLNESHRQCFHKIIELINRTKSISQKTLTVPTVVVFHQYVNN